ncbi:uncharacterized protein LOC143202854 isoform X2 [Rhynchophorus ferrugineus]|uniref:CUB domain-containing protein n=1 Tax=Rhynchophorus ferrugineus TaxID=354439 RepID=A0A834HZX8_RHYFE|nr:hypothetical protein GWI33_017050 [Rhynchophorus ferrugineus]
MEMIAAVLVMLVVLVQNAISGYIEQVEISGCESCRLMLTCRKLDSIIAILDVDFEMKEPIIDTGVIPHHQPMFPPDHPLDALNKRCSGVNHCSFILREDSPGSESWGPGNVTIKYACATQDRIQRYCNSEIILDEAMTSGLLHNPGYPRFYAGQRRCSWKITARPHQKILLRILDLALFDTKVSLMEDCKDILEIKDSNQIIYSTCEQEHPPSEVLSGGDSVEVILKSRQEINARRGVLIYFKAFGCHLPSPPEEGYLVSRNDSFATYTCCRGLVFPDTQAKTRTIRCLGTVWNISLPLLGCEAPQPHDSIYLQKPAVVVTKEMSSELIAPILIILVLFAVNGVIIFYIHKAKKKNAIEVRDEELGTFTENKG